MSEEKEIWKDIKGYEGLYQVSNLGRIKSLQRYRISKSGTNQNVNEKILKQSCGKTNKYLNVTLAKNKKNKTFQIHRLAALNFIPNPNNYPQVNHKDGNKQNNCVDNLEWCTCKENINHAWKNGLNHISEKHRKVASDNAKKRWKKYREELD